MRTYCEIVSAVSQNDTYTRYLHHTTEDLQIYLNKTSEVLMLRTFP
jgi:hypothetical protein